MFANVLMLRSFAPPDSRGRCPHMGLLFCAIAWLLHGRFFGNCSLEIVQRLAQAGFEIDFWLPLQQPPGLANVGAALFGIFLRQWFVANRALRSSYFQNHLRAFKDREFVGIAESYGQMFVR